MGWRKNFCQGQLRVLFFASLWCAVVRGYRGSNAELAIAVFDGCDHRPCTEPPYYADAAEGFFEAGRRAPGVGVRHASAFVAERPDVVVFWHDVGSLTSRALRSRLDAMRARFGGDVPAVLMIGKLWKAYESRMQAVVDWQRATKHRVLRVVIPAPHEALCDRFRVGPCRFLGLGTNTTAFRAPWPSARDAAYAFDVGFSNTMSEQGRDLNCCDRPFESLSDKPGQPCANFKSVYQHYAPLRHEMVCAIPAFRSAARNLSIFDEGHVDLATYRRAIWRTKVWPATTELFSHMGPRFYDVLASGSAMLIANNDTRAYDAVGLVPGRDFVVAYDSADFAAKVRYYATHEAERRAIVAQGATDVERHSWTARGTALIDEVCEALGDDARCAS